MDFSFSQEHLMTQRMVQNFTHKEILPVIKEYDRKQEPIPFALPRMGELGILGICFPVRYGGQGMDFISMGLACEELEAADTSLRVAMSVHVGLCSLTLLQWGTEEQKQKFLVPLASGKKLGCGVFTEPGMGSDLAGMRTSAPATVMVPRAGSRRMPPHSMGEPSCQGRAWRRACRTNGSRAN